MIIFRYRDFGRAVCQFIADILLASFIHSFPEHRAYDLDVGLWVCPLHPGIVTSVTQGVGTLPMLCFVLQLLH